MKEDVCFIGSLKKLVCFKGESLRCLTLKFKKLNIY
jgi:hypothetical protein